MWANLISETVVYKGDFETYWLGNFLGDLFAKYQVTLVYRLFWSQLCFAKIASQLKKTVLCGLSAG
jgi:hypothetical protein